MSSVPSETSIKDEPLSPMNDSSNNLLSELFAPAANIGLIVKEEPSNNELSNEIQKSATLPSSLSSSIPTHSESKSLKYCIFTRKKKNLKLAIFKHLYSENSVLAKNHRLQSDIGQNADGFYEAKISTVWLKIKFKIYRQIEGATCQYLGVLKTRAISRVVSSANLSRINEGISFEITRKFNLT